jgi:hypothetical protein
MKNPIAEVLVGRRVLGWTLVEYIDSGASADVYRGTCDEKEGAVKVYRSWVTDTDPSGGRLTREIKSLQGLSHAHVCQFLTAGEELIDGENR